MFVTNREKLLERLRRENVFWSFDKHGLSDLDDDIVIEFTLRHADVVEIILLFRSFDTNKIRDVWERRLASDPREIKLNYWLAAIFFEIENPMKWLQVKLKDDSRHDKLERLAAANTASS